LPVAFLDVPALDLAFVAALRAPVVFAVRVVALFFADALFTAALALPVVLEALPFAAPFAVGFETARLADLLARFAVAVFALEAPFFATVFFAAVVFLLALPAEERLVVATDFSCFALSFALRR
jgi:hypothetical protein